MSLDHHHLVDDRLSVPHARGGVWADLVYEVHGDRQSALCPGGSGGGGTAGCAAYFRKSDSGAEVLEAIRRLAA